MLRDYERDLRITATVASRRQWQSAGTSHGYDEWVQLANARNMPYTPLAIANMPTNERIVARAQRIELCDHLLDIFKSDRERTTDPVRRRYLDVMIAALEGYQR